MKIATIIFCFMFFCCSEKSVDVTLFPESGTDNVAPKLEKFYENCNRKVAGMYPGRRAYFRRPENRRMVVYEIDIGSDDAVVVCCLGNSYNDAWLVPAGEPTLVHAAFSADDPEVVHE